MSKLGVPYPPCSLVWTKISGTSILLSTLPSYQKSLDILELKFALEFLILTGIGLHFFYVPPFMHEEKAPECF